VQFCGLCHCLFVTSVLAPIPKSHDGNGKGRAVVKRTIFGKYCLSQSRQHVSVQ
jgi:hypothetical protein